MCLSSLVYHGLDQRSISRLLVIDSVEHGGTGIIGLSDHFRLHLVLLAFLCQSFAFFFGLTFFFFLVSTEGTFDDSLPFKATLLYFLQFTGIVINIRLSGTTTAITATSSSARTATIIIAVRIDVFA